MGISLPNCPICFDQFDELENISACACGHTFHHDCILEWAQKSQAQGKPALCPTCKKRFETNAARGVIRKLYFTFDQNSRPPPKTNNDSKLLQDQRGKIIIITPFLALVNFSFLVISLPSFVYFFPSSRTVGVAIERGRGTKRRAEPSS